MEALTPKDFAVDFDLSKPGRRVFIQGLGFVSVALLMGGLGGCESLIEAIRNSSAARTVAERIASIGFIPYSTIFKNSRAEVPCSNAPTSVPKQIFTPIFIAF